MLRPLLVTCCLAGTAYADPATYALVVGSNAAGPGQTTLKYAEDDAKRVGSVLTELGGVATANVDVVLQPSPLQLRDAIDRLTQRVAADIKAGKQARIFFYYSGHARASAIDLGPQNLPISELRQRLLAVGATLTVVVLDACQSGAFSRIKGATPAADFSFNSRQQLDASGVAVLASSSGSELSQESEQLKSSYFTHHLLVGMRGAGDANSDGTVSVDEAYRYAYHQTLLSTAMTAVGGQHVSLEVDLKGHGEVPLSFPRAANRTIVLPAQLEGQALVHDKKAKTVVAETYKARGAATRIAVAPGEYEVIVRQGQDNLRCDVATVGGESTVDMDRCKREKVILTRGKGGGFERPWHVEIAGQIGVERRDGYTETLENFGYKEDFLEPAAGVGLLVQKRIHEKLWVGGSATIIRSPQWTRETEEMPLRFDWNTTLLLGTVRGVHHFGETGLWSRFGFYADIGAGIAIGRTQLRDQDDNAFRDTHLGPALTAGAGFHLGYPGTWKRIPDFMMPLSMTLGYELVYAPAISNNAGDTHASGGHRITLGLGYDF